MSVLDISSVWKLVWSVKEWEEASESSGRKPNLLFSINTSKKGVKQKFEKKSWVQTIEEMPHSIDSILKQENEQRNHEQPPVFQFVLSISLNSSINGKWREIHFQNENKSLMTRDMELADIISIKMHRFLSLIEAGSDRNRLCSRWNKTLSVGGKNSHNVWVGAEAATVCLHSSVTSWIFKASNKLTPRLI